MSGTYRRSTREAFDTDAFYEQLNRVRMGRDNLSWRQLASEADVTIAGIGSELAAGRQPTVGNLIKLLLWMGETDLAPYIRAEYR